ncbi:MAG: hypothetical protein ACSHX0_04855 [Akkermansiaceae bacterium]
MNIKDVSIFGEDDGTVPTAPGVPDVPFFNIVEEAREASAHEVPFALEHALIGSFAMFQQHGIATSVECNQVAAAVKSDWRQGIGADPIEALAQLRANEGEVLDAIVEAISSKVASSLSIRPMHVPFVGRLMTPTGFYEKYPEIAKLCQLMMVLVSFNEDADVIGLTSINPHFSEALSHVIAEELKNEQVVTPLISITRMDYVSWRKMYEKHFRKGVTYD